MNEKKERPTFEFHFHDKVGQNIANVEQMTVCFDKDMQMQVMNAEQITAGENPVITLFDKLTRQAIAQHPGEWKEILKPYRSAIDAGAMDQCFSREQFNQRFGVEVPASPYSRWMTGSQEQYQYKDYENNAMIAQFEALKERRE